MWKLLLFTGLLGMAAYADKAVHSYSVEAQDAEDYAVAKGNPKAGDAVDNGDSCLSPISVRNFEKKSAAAIAYVQKHSQEGASNGQNVQFIKTALVESKLLKSSDLRKDDAQINPSNAGKSLIGFVNLLECDEWKNKLGHGETKDVPLGAVLVYEAEDHSAGDIRMKTPKGCIGTARKVTSEELNAGIAPGLKKEERSTIEKMLNDKAADEYLRNDITCGKNPGYKLVGVYVKNVN